MPTPVTDPDILRQLNAESPTPVTDPAILSQLNAPQQPPTFLQNVGSALEKTWPVRMAKDIYSAAKLPGDVYSGQTQVDVNDPQFMQRVTGLAGVTPVGFMPSVASAAPSSKQLISTGGKQIEDAVNSGLLFPADKVQAGIDAIRSTLPKRRNAEATHAAIDDLEKTVQSGQPITFDTLKQAREDLQAVQHNSAKSTGMTAATDLGASTGAKHALDDIVRGTPEGDQFIAGNANVSAGKLSETLDKKLYKSQLRAASTYSGKNIGNTIRQNVASLLTGKEGRTIPPEARDAAESVVFGSDPENFMRLWGNRLGGGQGLGWTATSGLAGALGYLGSGGSPTITGIAATALPIAGGILKHGANELAMSHLDALSQMLRSNTPLGQIVSRSSVTPEGIPAAKAALIRALLAQSAGQQPPQQ